MNFWPQNFTPNFLSYTNVSFDKSLTIFVTDIHLHISDNTYNQFVYKSFNKEATYNRVK